jgi:hypothetical protein
MIEKQELIARLRLLLPKMDRNTMYAHGWNIGSITAWIAELNGLDTPRKYAIQRKFIGIRMKVVNEIWKEVNR